MPPYGGYAPQPEKKKNKGLLIGCIAAGVVVVIAIVILVIWLVRGKDEETKPQDFSGQDAVVESDEYFEEDFWEQEQEEVEDTVAEEEPEQEVAEEISEAEAAYQYKLETGISGSVDYNVTNYVPDSIDYYQEYDAELITRLYDWGEIYNSYTISGLLYSVSENAEMQVEVFYHPETFEVERIITIQPEEGNMRVHDMYFDGGQLRLVIDSVASSFDPYGDITYSKQYLLYYTADRLVSLQIDRADGNPVEAYNCADYLSMDDGVQSLFLAREANYLNRAYTTYAAVTQ